MKKLHTRLQVSRLVGATAAIALFAARGDAQLRIAAPTYSTFISPEAPMVSFRAGGIFEIAGGVVLKGKAAFYAPADGQWIPVEPSLIQLIISSDKALTLRYRDHSYGIAIRANLVCPLAEFIGNGREIAYTLPPTSSPETASRLKNAGLMKIPNGDWVAREFSVSSLVKLMFSADFANTTPLPKDLETSIKHNINSAHSGGNFDHDDFGSYLNSDEQVTYQVFLPTDGSGLRIQGVPLRYHWDWNSSGRPVIRAVEAYSTNFSKPLDLGGSQRVSLNIYRVSGILRQLKLSNPSKYKYSVSKGCAAD